MSCILCCMLPATTAFMQAMAWLALAWMAWLCLSTHHNLHHAPCPSQFTCLPTYSTCAPSYNPTCPTITSYQRGTCWLFPPRHPTTPTLPTSLVPSSPPPPLHS